MGIVQEYCAGGDLRRVVKERAATGHLFSEDQVMCWFVQIAMALQYIHSEKVLHRDIKTSNILLAEPSGPGSALKLGDFGLSRVLEHTSDIARTIVGAPYYISPEVCQ